jgi:hypothetical protein
MQFPGTLEQLILARNLSSDRQAGQSEENIGDTGHQDRRPPVRTGSAMDGRKGIAARRDHLAAEVKRLDAG